MISPRVRVRISGMAYPDTSERRARVSIQNAGHNQDDFAVRNIYSSSFAIVNSRYVVYASSFFSANRIHHCTKSHSFNMQTKIAALSTFDPPSPPIAFVAKTSRPLTVNLLVQSVLSQDECVCGIPIIVGHPSTQQIDVAERGRKRRTT